MKTLIVYFPLNKQTKSMAFTIHYQLDNATLYPIVLKDQLFKSSFLQSLIFKGKTLFNKSMPIKPNPLNMEDYEVIIIGVPIWAGEISAPIKSFLNQHYLESKTVALFTNGENITPKLLQQIKTLIPESPIVAILAMATSRIDTKYKNKIAEFLKVITHHFEGGQVIERNQSIIIY